MSVRRLRGLLVAALLVLLTGILPAHAAAHASLLKADPASGAVLDRSPQRVVFSFSERVEGSFGALRVVDDQGRRVDDGQVSRPGGKADQLAIGIRPGTGNGAFTAAYRVVSADGHPVVGGVTFVVGRDVTAVPRDVRSITDAQAAPAGIGTALSVARVVRYLGIAGACGLLILLVAVWHPLRRAGRVQDAADEAFVGTAGRALRTVAVVGAVGAVAALVLQAANAGGTGIGDAIRPDTLREVLGTRTGSWFGISAVTFVVLAVLAPRAVRQRDIRSGALLAALVALAVLVVSPVLGGHAAASSPAWALIPLQLLHVLGMGAWIGGLLGLLVAVPRATRSLPAGQERTRLLAAVLLGFSPVAVIAVIALIAAGTVTAILQMTTLYDLTDTAYGRAVLIKALLVVGAVGIAVLQREYLLPKLRRVADGDEDVGPALAGRHVRSALRGELVLLTVVLAVTGALAGYAPPKALSAGPASIVRTVGAVQIQLTVDPARTGTNGMHLYAFDRTGQPLRRVEDLNVRATPPGRAGGSDVPVDVPFVVSGPGHWTAAAVPLGTAGTWKIRIVARLSEFDQLETTLPVRIR